MRHRLAWLIMVLAVALMASACTGEGESVPVTVVVGTTTTATPTTATPTTTTTEAPEPGFVGATLDSGGCDYGGLVNTITAVDEFVVEFTLCGPHPGFLAQIAFGVFGIQSEENLNASGGAPLETPVGTGPYVLKEWIRGDSVVYLRNDSYYGEIPAQSTAVLEWDTDSAQRLARLQSGSADGMTAPSVEDHTTLGEDEMLQLLDRPEPDVFYIGFNNTFHPWNSVDVRMAVALGIDRQRIVDAFYPPGSTTASHFTPCSVQHGCEGDEWHGFDASAAKKLLADAGFPNGFKTKIYYPTLARAYLPTPGLVAADIRAQLKKNLNIDAELVAMESSEFIASLSDGDLDGIHLFGWTGKFPHVTNFLDFHFAETNQQFGDPYEAIFEPLESAARTTDAVTAAPLYEEANGAIKNLVPMIPIAHSGDAFGATDNVEGAYAPSWGEVMLNLWDNGTDELVFIQRNEPASLYCADETDSDSLRACAQVVEALYSYSAAGDVQPQLATGCTPNGDLSVWTCSLREGVVFHDGTTFDANDVVASFSAGLDASDPNHVGNSGRFVYYDYLWNGLINADG